MNSTKERSTVLMAIAALIAIATFLFGSTWHTLSRQTEAEEQHLLLVSRSVLLVLEHSLSRESMPESFPTPHMVDLFQTMEQEGDLVFAGLFTPQENKIFAASRGQTLATLPPAVAQALALKGQWYGRMPIGGRPAYIYAKKISPDVNRPVRLDALAEAGACLLVAIDLQQHLSAYQGFRQNAVFQAVYMLVAALCLWGLTVSFLARRKQAARAVFLENFQSRLFDNLPDGLLTLDAAHHIRSVNPAACTILQRKPEHLLGQPLEALPPSLLPCLAVQAGAEEQTGWQRVSAEGAHLEILTLPFADTTAAFLIIIRDRTRLRTLEQNLAEAEKLAAIGSLAAGVAHEVRNPLSALRGFAQYFLKRFAGKQPEEEYAKTMVQEADRLNRVISDLLFLSRPNALQPTLVSLSELAQTLRTLLRFDLEQKQLILQDAFTSPTVFADADALKQILLNLLLNSLSFTPTGGSPLILRSGVDSKGTWIQVEDKGCGMVEQDCAQAFEPFFSTRPGGTGLGLALVQNIMHAHKGKASIQSRPSEGCTVTLYFPPAPPL